MIRLDDKLWIGDSGDEGYADLATDNINVLNVAQDLQATRGWQHGVEYMQVGLIDGPGNPLSAYFAAVAALITMLKRGNVLVCCHTGGRSVAVAIMYLNLTSRLGWDKWLSLLQERTDVDLQVPHEAHRAAFDRIDADWAKRRILVSLIED